MTPKLKNLFSHEFTGQIWRIEFDVQKQQLGLEIRDVGTLEVSFGFIELEYSRVLWDDLKFESGWWTGLSGLHNGFMLFYTYEDQENPELKNTFALQVEEKEVHWAYEGYNHLAFRNGSSIGVSIKDEERLYSSIQLESGELSSLSDEEALKLLQEESDGLADEKDAMAFPVQYMSDSSHFLTVQAFIAEHLGVEAVKGCEYLEIFDKIIISFYTANREMLANHILVCNEQAEVLLHQQINDAGDGIAFDTFFVSGKKLIFTKEKRTIECYEIF